MEDLLDIYNKWGWLGMYRCNNIEIYNFNSIYSNSSTTQ